MGSSYLYRPDTMVTQSSKGFSAIQTNNTQLTASNQVMRNISHIYGSGTGVGGTSMSATDVAGTGLGFVNGTTYLLIAKFTNIGFGGTKVATWWALDAAKFDLVKAGGITETELTANAICQASQSSTNTVTFTNSPNCYVLMQLNSYNNTLSQTVDELRYGSTLADVVPVAVVPEPATLALLGLGGLALLKRQRKS